MKEGEYAHGTHSTSDRDLSISKGTSTERRSKCGRKCGRRSCCLRHAAPEVTPPAAQIAVLPSTPRWQMPMNAKMQISSTAQTKASVDTMWQRYLENLYLLGMAWVRKVRHFARLTLNSKEGPFWPTYIEPLALKLFDFLGRFSIDWTRVRETERADFADEIDFVWRVNPPWLPPEQKMYIPIWEYVVGMARTWDWNWNNEVRKQGAPEEVWRLEDRHPRGRYHSNTDSASKHHHLLVALRVPTIAQYIRTNKFYRVGDEETACRRPESSPRCRGTCHHTKYANTLEERRGSTV